jgi:hypothetical protein
LDVDVVFLGFAYEISGAGGIEGIISADGGE